MKNDMNGLIFKLEPQQSFQRNCMLILFLEPLDWVKPLDWTKPQLWIVSRKADILIRRTSYLKTHTVTNHVLSRVAQLVSTNRNFFPLFI